MESKTFSREELYNLIWSEPMSSLAKKYEISDVGLKKICLRMNVPVPQHGHWQRLKSGKKTKVFKLPTDHQGDEEITLNLRSENDSAKPSAKAAIALLQKEIEENITSLLQVPARLSNSHKLIEAAKRSLDLNDVRWCQFLNVVHVKGLDIRVAKEYMPRAFRFMDTLIKALHARGYKVEIHNDLTNVNIYGEDIRIFFREKLKRITVKHGTYETSEMQGNGVLFFGTKRFSEGKEWRDGKLSIEAQLSHIMASLEYQGARLRKERAERELRWGQMEEKERIEKEARERKEKELKDFKNLLHDAARWEKVKLLREYIDDIESNAKKNNNPSEQLSNWLIWVKEKLDWYDPMVAIEDELLKGLNKETLEFDQRNDDNDLNENTDGDNW
jgi:hypothetical protein